MGMADRQYSHTHDCFHMRPAEIWQMNLIYFSKHLSMLKTGAKLSDAIYTHHTELGKKWIKWSFVSSELWVVQFICRMLHHAIMFSLYFETFTPANIKNVNPLTPPADELVMHTGMILTWKFDLGIFDLCTGEINKFVLWWCGDPSSYYQKVPCWSSWGDPGGHFKNTHGLLNLRALKFSPVNKIHIVWVRYFVSNLKFHTNILPINWKIWFSYNIEISRALRFKSSYASMKRPNPFHKGFMSS